jgi:Recombination endonuclease VII
LFFSNGLYRARLDAMSVRKDRVGEVWRTWEVVALDCIGKKETTWRCRCQSCGVERVIPGGRLRTGNVTRKGRKPGVKLLAPYCDCTPVRKGRPGTLSRKSGCTEAGCDRLSLARGLCSAHYNRARAAGLLGGIPKCRILGCESFVLAKGLCAPHYSRAQQSGDVGTKCTEAGCVRGAFSHGRCTRHFSKAVRAGAYGVRCVIDGCSGFSSTISKPGACESCRKRMVRYGLGAGDISRLLTGTTCELCRTTTANHIDHCHKTGRVRGFLCGPCNMALGSFNDDPVKLRAAADYLERVPTELRGDVGLQGDGQLALKRVQ